MDCLREGSRVKLKPSQEGIISQMENGVNDGDGDDGGGGRMV